jgi:ferredoxin
VGGRPCGSEGLDVLLTDVGDAYWVNVVSPKGQSVVSHTSELLTKPTDDHKKEVDSRAAHAETTMPRAVSVENLPEKIETNFDNPQWRTLAFKCVGCGICTYTCPTCHCFDIQDETIKGQGRRVRLWDSCMFSEYTLHASGQNPRPTRAERLRNRMYHKFKQTIELFGTPGCVGCGRCITLCPVNEDLIENLEAVGNL